MMSIGFCQMLFLHLLIGSCDFSLAYWCDRLYWLIFKCWTISYVTAYNPFLYVVGLHLLTVCWELLYLSSWVIFVYSFLLCNIFVWFWYQSNAGLIEWVRKHSFCFYFIEEIVQNWYNFFLKCLVEITSDHIWAHYCLFQKLITYLISLIDKDLFRLSTTWSFDKRGSFHPSCYDPS